MGITTNALIPSSVARAELSHGIYLSGIAQRGAEFLGPAFATPLLAQQGVAWIYPFSALLSAMAILLAAGIRPSRAQLNSVESRLGWVKLFTTGLSYAVRTTRLRTLIFSSSIHCVLTMAYVSLLPGFVASSVHARTGFYGTLLTYAGLGAISGTYLSRHVSLVG